MCGRKSSVFLGQKPHRLINWSSCCHSFVQPKKLIETWKIFAVRFLNFVDFVKSFLKMHHLCTSSAPVTRLGRKMGEKTWHSICISPKLNHDLIYDLTTQPNDFIWIFQAKKMPITLFENYSKCRIWFFF